MVVIFHSIANPTAFVRFTWDDALDTCDFVAAGFDDSVDTDALVSAMVATDAHMGKDFPGFTWDFTW